MAGALSVSSSVGNTPLLKISDRVYAKHEALNPGGSIKDRMARFILDRAEARGTLPPGGTIIEATSGNTGIAFSMLAAERGFAMIVVMPCDMSRERKAAVRAFGAELIEVGCCDFLGAVALRDELARNKGFFVPGQFSNPDNITAHEIGTGAEICRQAAELPDNPAIVAFVAGIGTGGTLMGVRRALIGRFPQVKTVAVEPEESQVLRGETPRPHLIQGIGDGFIPELVDTTLIDRTIAISSADAIARAQRLAKEMGLLAGISSGANVLAAERYIEEHQPDGIVVTVLPDSQERYFSMLS